MEPDKPCNAACPRKVPCFSGAEPSDGSIQKKTPRHRGVPPSSQQEALLPGNGRPKAPEGCILGPAHEKAPHGEGLWGSQGEEPGPDTYRMLDDEEKCPIFSSSFGHSIRTPLFGKMTSTSSCARAWVARVIHPRGAAIRGDDMEAGGAVRVRVSGCSFFPPAGSTGRPWIGT